ncbi:MAG: site-specific integrase, partial [Lachnospiraceae bacterium]|nr:site-specific integrase [Lachnospiraceae bacterium]
PAWITENFTNTLNKLDIPHFRFHDLRHYSASIMHALGASDECIMNRGGWATDHALKEHYRGNMSEYDTRFTKKLNKHFEKKFAV